VKRRDIDQFHIRPSSAEEGELIDDDFETLLVDPLVEKGALYLVAKQRFIFGPGQEAGIFRTQLPDQEVKEELIMNKVGGLPYDLLVGGDISSDGTTILLRRARVLGGLGWRRKTGQVRYIDYYISESLVCLAFLRMPCTITF